MHLPGFFLKESRDYAGALDGCTDNLMISIDNQSP